jgi:hypothetical protein
MDLIYSSSAEEIQNVQLEDEIRKKNIMVARNSAEQERAHRMSLIIDAQHEERIIRKQDKIIAIMAEDAERRRRVGEVLKAEKEALEERQVNIKMAIEMAEEERRRRMAMFPCEYNPDRKERQEALRKVKEMEELERFRRMSESNRISISTEETIEVEEEESSDMDKGNRSSPKEESSGLSKSIEKKTRVRMLKKVKKVAKAGMESDKGCTTPISNCSPELAPRTLYST